MQPQSIFFANDIIPVAIDLRSAAGTNSGTHFYFGCPAKDNLSWCIEFVQADFIRLWNDVSNPAFVPPLLESVISKVF